MGSSQYDRVLTDTKEETEQTTINRNTGKIPIYRRDNNEEEYYYEKTLVPVVKEVRDERPKIRVRGVKL